MIGVAMRNQHRIETLETEAQCLLAKVGGSVDEDGPIGMLDDYGNAQAFVTWVFRSTGLTLATDRRHTRRGSGTEESKSHLPPVMSVPEKRCALGGVFTSDTYCIRRSASRPSSI